MRPDQHGGQLPHLLQHALPGIPLPVPLLQAAKPSRHLTQHQDTQGRNVLGFYQTPSLAQLYGLSCGIVPIQESWWLAPLLILTPLCLSVCLSLPALLLHLPHPMSAIPGGQLCLTTQPDTLQQQMTYHSSLAILGFCLPLAIIICLVIGLSVRRCVSCYTTICVSSFCKEELLLALLTLPVTASQLLLFLPVLDRNLLQLQLPVSGVADLVSPTTARILEMLSSGKSAPMEIITIIIALSLPGALPLLAFSLLPAYSSWTARPDGDDMRWGYR